MTCGRLPELLAVTHRLNARNGRVFWDLVGMRAADLSADLAMVAAEGCGTAGIRFAVGVTELLWRARGGQASGAVAGQGGRGAAVRLRHPVPGRRPGPHRDQVAHVSARVIEAAVASALARPA